MLNLDIRTALGQLDEDQLQELHDLVVVRLKQFREIRNKAAMWDMLPGDTVRWEYEGLTYLGHIQKLNTKTVSVLSDDGRRWKIHPTLLSQVKHA
jgi:hypothetical protein